MRSKKLSRFALPVILVLCLSVLSSFAEEYPEHPLLVPQTAARASTRDRFTNILLLGVDHGFDGYWGSHQKQALEICHTDAFMVVSINMTKAKADIISIPRDTVTYVPGVRGLYKLNAAFNCADTLEEGFRNACEAASWHLGGIKIDYYVCVDMNAMIQLGDQIGGVDMELEMNYHGSGGRYYRKGFQHLDGQGMMDYARARKNATVNYNDLGRTGRQRQVVTAIMKKLAANPGLIKPAWNYATGGELNFFTDMKLANVLNLANKVKSCDTVGSYVLTGPYRNSCRWNFTFTDPENRQAVIKAVWGIEAAPLPYVSFESLEWLDRYGFDHVHRINLSGRVLAEGRARTDLNEDGIRALDDLETALGTVMPLFDRAAYDLDGDSLAALNEAEKTLTAAADTAHAILEPEGEKLVWNRPTYWYRYGTYINDYTDIEWG